MSSCGDAVFSVGSIGRFIVQLFEIVVQVGFPQVLYCWLATESFPPYSLGEGVEDLFKRYGVQNCFLLLMVTIRLTISDVAEV